MQKISVALLLVAFSLILYAGGIVTNVFASPMFSSFWLISYATAHGFVVYLAVTLAVVLGLSVLAVNFFDIWQAGLSFEPEGTAFIAVDFSNEVTADDGVSADSAAVTGSEPFTNVEWASEVGNSCGCCKKAFEEPLYKVNYVNSLPTLTAFCPYCSQPLDQSKK